MQLDLKKQKTSTSTASQLHRFPSAGAARCHGVEEKAFCTRKFAQLPTSGVTAGGEEPDWCSDAPFLLQVSVSAANAGALCECSSGLCAAGARPRCSPRQTQSGCFGVGRKIPGAPQWTTCSSHPCMGSLGLTSLSGPGQVAVVSVGIF